MNKSPQPPSVLTIAGSDSGSAAGIQADLKTFSAYGVHGLTAITSVTAQNTSTINRISVLPQDLVLAQLDTVLADFRIEAVKIGMLGSTANVRAIARWLRAHRLGNIVVDPVLTASSGGKLLPDTAIAVLLREILPLAQILTPNVPEAEALLAQSIRSPAEMRAAAHALRKLGADAVLIKGGHLDAQRVHDYFVDGDAATEFTHRRRKYAVRGTGCTLASALAAGLALGLSPRDAAIRAENYLQNAFRAARQIGRGASRVLQHNVSGEGR